MSVASDLPFQDALTPLVDAARGRLQAAFVQIAGRADLERQLYHTLVWLWGPTLFHEFSVRRALQIPTALLPFAASSHAIYDDFIDVVRSGALMREYPVLARCSALAVELWIESSTELLTRLALDAPMLRRVFGTDGRVVAIRPDLSDRHNGGRTVCIVEFENGVRVVYKPRSVQLEHAWFDVLRWCDGRGLSLPLHRFEVVERGDYGWVEYVPSQPLEDGNAARRFYHRAGLLVCLLYVLEANDCHFENVIAYGDQPVLIDLETLLHARSEDLFPPDPEAATATANRALWSSVMRTRFLPRWVFLSSGLAFDLSGLGAMEALVDSTRVPHWSHLASDALSLQWAPYALAASGAVMEGQALAPETFVDDMVAGFREMYALLRKDSASLPLERMRGARARCLVRSTRIYTGLLDEAWRTPALLRDEAAFEAHLDRLWRGIERLPPDHAYRRVVALEQAAMRRLDVPWFWVPVEGVSLHGEGAVLDDVYAVPALQRVKATLASLADDDCRLQEAIIRGSLAARGAPDPTRMGASRGPNDSNVQACWDPERAIEAAARVGLALSATAMRGDDGGATWISLRFFPEAGRYQLQPADVDLYDGAAGIGLFLASLAAVSGDAACASLARSAFLPLRRAVPSGIGACVGIGGCVYALASAARLLDDDALRVDAERLAAHLTADRIDEDRELDVFGGAAGALLGLLSVGDTDGARRCANHLLASQLSDGGWMTMQARYARPLTGFAHGAAGIAASLLRLHAVTGDDDLGAAAEAAFSYERSVFSVEQENWPDFRSEPPIFVTHWCHGAAGIGLSRLELKQASDADLGAALRTTRACAPRGVDHLCCGTMGRASILFELGLALGDPSLEQEARAWAAVVAARETWSLLGGGAAEVTNPGLFQGTAGIGLGLLRLARPDIVPAVLRFA